MVAESAVFERCVLASGLVTQEQLDEARAALRWSDRAQPAAAEPVTDRQLADKLQELGRLNAWQADQLLQGRSKFNLGPYWIVDSIGQGGMGQVFKAVHATTRQETAIKVLPRSKTTPESIANFLREIRLLTALEHPHLVRALDHGHDGNVYFMVTEYVPGVDLRKLVRRSEPLSMEAAALAITDVAMGLHYAHQQGLIHRDVKPGNILVMDDGHAKLLDMGLSGPVDGGVVEDPRFGKIVGTADYLSPDHITAPWDPKPAWDIYSLGCTLYYAVTGKVPFPGGTLKDKVRAHCELRPLDPRRLNPRLSAEFVDVIADMMAKNPSERLQSALEVIERLKPWTTADGALSPAPARARRRERQGASPVDALIAGIDDTSADFPEMPELVADGREMQEQAGQATSPFGSYAEQTAPMLRLGPHRSRRESHFLLNPLMVLVAFPLGLVFLVVLAYWLATRFFS